MEFPLEFFEDEVRDGFYVPGEMKACWAAQTEVLMEIARICKKHNIQWFADFGTLLGAIRHKHCVPWDDDFDIVMKRPDFMKFMGVMKAELGSDYHFMNIRQKDNEYWNYINRIDNGPDITIEPDRMKKFHNFPYIAGVDIFCLDYVPRDPGEMELIEIIAGASQKIAVKLMPDEEEDEEDKEISVDELIDIVDALTGRKFDRNGDIIQQTYVLNDSLFAMYSEDEADYLALMPDYIDSGRTYQFKKEWFDETVMVPLEHFEVPAPKHYDEVLTQRYGDYMQPYRAGGSHNYPYYEKLREPLADAVGPAPYIYIFDEKDLYNDERVKGRNLRQQAVAIAQMLLKIHEEIKQDLNGGVTQNVMGVLTECQQAAISIGTAIDETQGDNHPTVKLLEEYCEQLYECSQCVESVAECIEALRVADEIIERVKDSADRDIRIKKQIVFMPYKASAWQLMEDDWRRYMADEDWDVYVIPVPYFYKIAESGERDIICEADMLPDYVQVTPYDSYSFERNHPDIIYIQNPYDHANFAVSVLPSFYSGNLKKYTERLIYKPYFVTDDFDEEDGRSILQMRWYVNVPGIMHADEVILPSENMKNNYLKTVLEFTDEKYRDIFEKKFKIGVK